MKRVLILYSTVDGQTRRIAERIQARMAAQDHQICLMPLERAEPDWATIDKVVIGASIRYGKFRPALFEFIERHQASLAQRQGAFFCVNLVARKAQKASPDSNPYMARFRKQSVWAPQLEGVFAGKLNYPLYGFWDRQIIRFIMWLTKGPTDGQAVVEYTDWGRVEVFADRCSSL